MNEKVYERAAELMEAELGDELVALEPEQGSCFGFNAVAARVWRLLEQPKSFEELKQLLLTEYDVNEQQCADELQALIEDLLEKGLVRRCK